MIMQDQKKLAQMLIGSKKDDGTEALEQGPEVQNDSEIAMDAVATKIMSAFEKKDKKALIEGLRDFMDIIQSEDVSQDAAMPAGV